METAEVGRRSRGFKIIIILLLILAIALLGIIGYFTVFGGDGSKLASVFSAEEEHTMLLDEFVVNLQNEESNGRNYVKAEIALMYTDKNEDKLIENNTLKIRDTIINHLRLLTSEEILNGENTPELKSALTQSINSALGEEVIADIYFANLLVQ